MASIIPGLRRAAPRLSKDFFICHQCLKTPRPALRPSRLPPKASPRTTRFYSSNPTAGAVPGQINIALGPTGNAAVNALRKEYAAASFGSVQKVKKGFFPETSSNSVAYWLLASAGSVFGLVVFGGLTRLTESGYVTYQ